MWGLIPDWHAEIFSTAICQQNVNPVKESCGFELIKQESNPCNRTLTGHIKVEGKTPANRPTLRLPILF